MAIADLDPTLMRRGVEVVASSYRETDLTLLSKFGGAFRDRASQPDMPEAQPYGLVSALRYANRELFPFPPEGNPHQSLERTVDRPFRTALKEAALGLEDQGFLRTYVDALQSQDMPLPNTIRQATRNVRKALAYYADYYKNGRINGPW